MTQFIPWCIIKKNWRIIAYFLIIVIYFLLIQEKPYKKYSPLNVNEHATNNSTTSKSIGCEVAERELDVWMFLDDYAQKKNTENHERCGYPKEGILERNSTHLFTAHHISQFGEIRCCYDFFPTELNVNLATLSDFDPLHCKYFYSSMKLSKVEQFVKVACFLEKKSIYENIFLFLPQNFYNAKKKKNRKIKQIEDIPLTSSTRYNVIVLGIDAVSKLTLEREMPNTLSIIKDMGAIELTSYSNVGDHASSSLAPLLTGLTQFELIENCMDFENFRKQYKDCSLLWSNFKKFGYVTAMGESSTIKYYDHTKYYFDTPDTDYNFHVYMYEEQNVNENSVECLQEKTFHEAFLDYTKDITETLNSSKLFGFFWEATANKNSLKLDDAYEQFFMNLKQSLYLENTIIFFIGNHEKRHIMKVDRFDARIPFAYVMLPSSFQKQYQKATKNLETNSKRLTTPLDIHKTLVYLSNTFNLDDINIKLDMKSLVSTPSRSYNLFLKIPEDRTCEDAMIDSFWCPCVIKKPIDKYKAHFIASVFIKHLNSIIEDVAGCLKVLASKVGKVTEMVSPYRRQINVYLVEEVHVSPYGDGIYTGELIHNQLTKNWTIRHIKRINSFKYNKCTLKEPDLAPYCSCVEKL